MRRRRVTSGHGRAYNSMVKKKDRAEQEKRPRGRPPVPDEERRDKRAYVALSGAEMAKLDARAKKAGLSRYGYMRLTLLGKAD